jgi:(1->4)-alpha-D-glucan 1-alpha-D-glucosylmutase
MVTTAEPILTESPRAERTPYAEELLATALDQIARRRAVPGSTYRIQLHEGFRFQDAAAMVPYLARLGISDCYASPYLKSAPGSTHGYDITDPCQLNPEIGTAEEHAAWQKALRSHGLGLVLDVVPNHMGILGNENPWWNDVLENGQASPYSGFFDIDWSAPVRPENRGRILLPFLGDLYGVVLEKKELRLGREGGSFHVQYHEHRFPLDPKSYAAILEPLVEPISGAKGEEDPSVAEFQSVLTAIRNLPAHTETSRDRVLERHREKEVIKRRIATLLADHAEIDAAIQGSIDRLNGTEGDPRSFDALDELLGGQPYRLAYWRVASDEINYRRFFDVNTLAALRTDREEVFRATHAMIMEILASSDVTGVRIDHPDGLLDPRVYLERLQEAFVVAIARRIHEDGITADVMPWDELIPNLRERLALRRTSREQRPSLYVVVEKILGFDEPFPEGWITDGTSGYDALNRMSGILVDTSNAEAFTRRYQAWIGDQTPYRDIVRRNKQLILDVSLASELHVLAHQLERIALRDRRSRDFTQSGLRHALREVIASFPVYRSYITARSVTEQDKALVDRAVRSAMRRNPATSRAVFRFLRNVLLDRVETPQDLPDDQPAPSDFAGKFQQVTAPVMAKGLEDTTFYVYNRLVSLNEVGGEPVRFGLSPAQLHAWNGDRARRFPHALSPLSTHDTKRSEDVRARISVLSEIPDDWFQAVERWSGLNQPHRKKVEEREVPDRNEEYFLYQNLLGAWPIEALDDQGFETFRQRIRAFMGKAIHEAKVNSSWLNPDPDYDEAIDQFVVAILDREANRAFLEDFATIQRIVSHHGFLNSLAQTVLKLASPGVPDTYQGTELWDFSLVDPDNRRPVDYGLRARLLSDLATWHEDPGTGPAGLARDLVANLEDGRIKLYTHWRTLAARREFPALFASGEYQPLNSLGTRAEHVFAFLRRDGANLGLVAVPRLTTKLVAPDDLPLGTKIWADTELELNGVPPGTEFRSIFTGARVRAAPRGQTAAVRAADLFASFPFAILIGHV